MAGGRCFKVGFVCAFRDAIPQTLVVSSGNWKFRLRSVVSTQSAHSPLNPWHQRGIFTPFPEYFLLLVHFLKNLRESTTAVCEILSTACLTQARHTMPHSKSLFYCNSHCEFQQDISITSTCLNALSRCHVIGQKAICVYKYWSKLSNNAPNDYFFPSTITVRAVSNGTSRLVLTLVTALNMWVPEFISSIVLAATQLVNHLLWSGKVAESH